MLHLQCAGACLDCSIVLCCCLCRSMGSARRPALPSSAVLSRTEAVAAVCCSQDRNHSLSHSLAVLRPAPGQHPAAAATCVRTCRDSGVSCFALGSEQAVGYMGTTGTVGDPQWPLLQIQSLAAPGDSPDASTVLPLGFRWCVVGLRCRCTGVIVASGVHTCSLYRGRCIAAADHCARKMLILTECWRGVWKISSSIYVLSAYAMLALLFQSVLRCERLQSHRACCLLL